MCSTPIRLSMENRESGWTSTSTSRSLSGRASPRARGPKMASFVTPSAFSAGAADRMVPIISSRVISYFTIFNDRRPCQLQAANVNKPEISLLRRLLLMPQPPVERGHERLRGLRDYGTGREDCFRACRLEGIVILRRHHPADHD